MAKIAVYCGSGTPGDPGLLQMAFDVGRDLAANGHTLLYGGSKNGLMGEVARGALAGGGKVVGYRPASLQGKEPPLDGIELHRCAGINERMEAFRREADAYLVLPGGTGTMEEFAAMLNAMAFGLWQLPVEETMPLKPLALMAHPLTRPLWDFVDSAMDAGLVDGRLRPMLAYAPWAELREWLKDTVSLRQIAA